MIELPEPWPPNPWPTRFRTIRASDPTLVGDGLTFLTVQSPALGGRGDLLVWAPPEVGPDVDVVVLLHGVYGSFWNWAFLGAAHQAANRLCSAHRHRSLVLVMPSDGLTNEGTVFAAWPNADYETWTMTDAVAAATEMLSASVRSISLIGTSMGAFAAARLAARRGGVAAVAMHSPITDMAHLAQFTQDDLGDLAGLPPKERHIQAFLPGGECAGSSPPPNLMVDCGRRDPLIDQVRQLHRTLKERQVAHHYVEVDGGHSWDVWRQRLVHSLAFVVEVTTSARETTATKGTNE